VLVERILRGYLGALRGLGLFFGLLILSGLISLVIVFPLWFLATRNKEVYTALVLIFLGLAVLMLLLFRIRRAAVESSPLLKERLMLSLKRFAQFFLFLVILYGIVLLFSLKLFFIASLSLIVFFVLFGIIRYGGKGSRSLK
jgi:hypothetical protein